jgi:oxygen-dependent protoporphyrinogen oxidase
MTRTWRAVVVGGGITGLAAAHRLVTGPGALDPSDVLVLEASDRLGGVIRSGQVDGQDVELGPESLVVQQPAGIELCRELGLEDELVAPDARDLYVLVGGRLRRFPERLFEGAPQGALGMVRSGVLTPGGALRAAMDAVLPRTRFASEDPSIGELVRRRLGRQALERLVDPMLGSIHGSSCDDLSARSLAPQLLAAAEQDRSIVLGLRRAARRRATTPASAPSSPFRSLRGGLAQLVDALATSLDGATIETRARVEAVRRDEDGTYVLACADGDEAVRADAVVLAAPAHALATMLDVDGLDEIEWAPAQLAVLSYDAADIDVPRGASGVLVPASEGRAISAVTIWSQKWAHRAHEGRVLVRCSTSRAGRHLLDEPDTGAVLDTYHRELAAILGPGRVRRAPRAGEIVRIERAQARYAPGHRDRVARIEASLVDSLGPGVRLAGAAFHGGGLGSCIASGRRAADCILNDHERERIPA